MTKYNFDFGKLDESKNIEYAPIPLVINDENVSFGKRNIRQILELLKDINRKLGITIVIITHEMKVIETICHRVAVIDDSHIVELGDVKDVFLHPKSKIARQLILPNHSEVCDHFESGQFDWSCSECSAYQYEARSRHPSGINALFCDGSCRFVSETVDCGNVNAYQVTSGKSPYGVWGGMSTPQGGETETM